MPEDPREEVDGVQASENFDFADFMSENNIVHWTPENWTQDAQGLMGPAIQPIDYLDETERIPDMAAAYEEVGHFGQHGYGSATEALQGEGGYAGALYGPSQPGGVPTGGFVPDWQATRKSLSHTEPAPVGGIDSLSTIFEQFAGAAINPSLLDIDKAKYRKFFPITFTSLSAWAAWAETDPMYTGTMGYVAYCLPGKTANWTCGNVELKYCRWAKKNEGGPVASNRKDYKQDMPDKAGTDDECSDAPWIVQPIEGHSYQRQCGPPNDMVYKSPAILGVPFPNAMDSAIKETEMFTGTMKKARDRMDRALENFDGLVDGIVWDTAPNTGNIKLDFRNNICLGKAVNKDVDASSVEAAVARATAIAKEVFGHNDFTVSSKKYVTVRRNKPTQRTVGFVSITLKRKTKTDVAVWTTYEQMATNAITTAKNIDIVLKAAKNGLRVYLKSARQNILQLQQQIQQLLQSIAAKKQEIAHHRRLAKTNNFEGTGAEWRSQLRAMLSSEKAMRVQGKALEAEQKKQAKLIRQASNPNAKFPLSDFLKKQGEDLVRVAESHKKAANTQRNEYIEAQQSYQNQLKKAAQSLAKSVDSTLREAALVGVVEQHDLPVISDRTEGVFKMHITPDTGPNQIGFSENITALWKNEYSVVEAIMKKTKIPYGLAGTIGRVRSNIPYTILKGVVIKNTAVENAPEDLDCDGYEDSIRNESADTGQGRATYPAGELTNDSNNSWDTNTGAGGSTSGFSGFGGKPGTNRGGDTSRQNPPPSFLSQDGCGAGGSLNETPYICGYAGEALWPSYAPTTAYDPTQQYNNVPGYSQTADGVSGPVSSGYHGNVVNGNDMRLIENCKIFAGNGVAINNIVQAAAAPQRTITAPNPLDENRGFHDRAMTIMMRNNIIVHNFASDAYPTESGLWDNKFGSFPNSVHNDVSLGMQLLLGPALGATYVQSTRTLTASGFLGTRMPSWIKRNSKVIFHTNHACSGISYNIDQRVSSSGLILSEASNPGSNVGPGATIEIRPKNYTGPYNQRKLKYSGNNTSVVSVKNRATNGGMLEVWMQNNTITAHPDANLPEPQAMLEPNYPGMKAHQVANLWHTQRPLAGSPGRNGITPALSGSIKSFAPKYISVLNISNSVAIPQSGGFNNPGDLAQTGFVQSHLNVNMENNLICPVYNARLPSGKTYADDSTGSSPKWDVVSDIGLPVVNTLSSGCMLTHSMVRGNVIVGRVQYDAAKQKYVQHNEDGDNIINALDQTSNREYPDFVKPGNFSYRRPFASGFSVYDGGPDDVFRSYFGPFYIDNLSDAHVNVTGKNDFMDSFSRQGCGSMQLGLNDGVFFRGGFIPSVVKKTFTGLIPPQNIFPQKTIRFDILGQNSAANNSQSHTKLPKSVLKTKKEYMGSQSNSYELSKDGKGIIFAGAAKQSQTRYFIGAIASTPEKTEQEKFPEKKHRPDPFNVKTGATVGQKNSNLKNGSYVNIDNGFAIVSDSEVTTRLKPDVITYPNNLMPVAEGGIRVASGGKNDKPIIGEDAKGEIAIHLGQTRDHVDETEKAGENIDRLFFRFLSQDGDGVQQ